MSSVDHNDGYQIVQRAIMHCEKELEAVDTLTRLHKATLTETLGRRQIRRDGLGAAIHLLAKFRTWLEWDAVVAGRGAGAGATPASPRGNNGGIKRAGPGNSR